MPEDTSSAVMNDVILNSGLTAEQYGLPRIAGEVCGLLFMTDGPLSLDEIAEALKVSKASVSTNVRLLERLRFVRRGDVREGKRDYYVFAGDVWEVTGDQLRTTVQEEMQTLLHNARDWHRRLETMPRPKDPKAAASLIRVTERMATLAQLYEMIANLVAALCMERKLSPAAMTHLWKAMLQYRKLAGKGKP
jgi:DNA-binding transcriptional regulator GbsR (MarR family)